MKRDDYVLFTPEIAKVLPAGTLLKLYYDDFNQGRFEYDFKRTIEEPGKYEVRAIGRFRYKGDEWSEEGDYIYEFRNTMCRGSGAERCFITNISAINCLSASVTLHRYSDVKDKR